MNRRQPLLIVNADDFGMTSGVSHGVLDAHRRGIVTSTSVLANGRVLTDFVPHLLDTPTLGLGAHLAVVGEDPPVLAAAEIPTLVGRDGHFALTWKTFLARAVTNRVDPDHVRLEFTAQLDRLLGFGLPIAHLDAHQHLQLWPSIAKILLTLGTQSRIGAVRVPRARSTNVTGIGVSILARRLARQANELGICFTQDSVGIATAGHIDGHILTEFLATTARRRPTSIELTVHPGRAEDPDRARYRWGYEWEQELAALTAPGVKDAVERAGLRLGTYEDLSTDVRNDACLPTEPAAPGAEHPEPLPRPGA